MTEAIAILVGILIGIILVLIVHSMYQKLNAKLTDYIEKQNKTNKLTIFCKTRDGGRLDAGRKRWLRNNNIPY